MIMAERSGIAWTGATWNPWTGCSRTSEACTRCYALRDIAKLRDDPTVVLRASDTLFYAPVNWQEPERIFTCSWSDFFHEDADQWRSYAWDIIKRTPHHRYLVLTKRPQNIASRLPADWGSEAYSHVALGVTVENQRRADERVPVLLENWANLYFVSCEPLLGQLNLSQWLTGERHIGWVIAGGESVGIVRVGDTRIRDADGRRRAEYSDPLWFNSLREQCEAAEIPYYLKQLGQVAKCDCGGNQECTTCHGDREYLHTTKRDHGKAVLTVGNDTRTYTAMPTEVLVPSDDVTVNAELVATAPSQDEASVVLIPIDNIIGNDIQVRTVVDTSALKELQQSISRYGILQPITVAKTDDPEKYALLLGQRRLMAVKALHMANPDDVRWKVIPCVIRELSDEKIIVAQQIIENIQREDLGVFDKAEALMKYKRSLGEAVTWKVVEDNLGISKRRREQIIRALKMPAEVRVIITEKGREHVRWRFTERHARELMKLQHNPQKLTELATAAVDYRWSLKKLGEEVEAALRSDAANMPPAPIKTVRYQDVLSALRAMPAEKADAFLRKLQEDLTQNETVQPQESA